MAGFQVWPKFVGGGPEKADVLLGDTLRWNWLELARNGTVNASDPRAFATVQQGGKVFTTNVVGRQHAGIVERLQDFTSPRCNALASQSLDSRWWWVN